MADWQDWIGRTHRQTDVLIPALVSRHRATLDLAPDNPAPLPGIHWALNPPEAATAELGEDGHPRRDTADSFLPPIDLPRRMWASSEVEFLNDIAVGATITRISSITDIIGKSGGSGRLAFVTLDHATDADGVAVIREKQTLVYREAVIPPSLPREGSGVGAAQMAPDQTMAPTPTPLLEGRGFLWPHHRTLTPSETMLFRFSALTFNTHRIHYDLPYARDVEGYKGLVVHGPLTATLLLNWASELFGPIRRFTFRAVSPAFAGQLLTLVARREDDSIALAALGPNGAECVKASATL
jgi:3-methylfumaryl-CoA hydratase